MSVLVDSVRRMTEANVDYAGVIERESASAADALARAPLAARVPSCPDWSAADLAYHLGTYHVTLPRDFLTHVRKARYRVPDVPEARLLEILTHDLGIGVD